MLHGRQQLSVKTGRPHLPGPTLKWCMVQWKLFIIERYYSGQVHTHLLLKPFEGGPFQSPAKIHGMASCRHPKRRESFILRVFRFQYTALCMSWLEVELSPAVLYMGLGSQLMGFLEMTLSWHGIPWNRVTDHCLLLCWCWELNLSPCKISNISSLLNHLSSFDFLLMRR